MEKRTFFVVLHENKIIAITEKQEKVDEHIKRWRMINSNRRLLVVPIEALTFGDVVKQFHGVRFS